ncbi:MAG: hypothetical protein Q7R49_04985 [Candidatus Daviesbacteria bacterium]|nr:hypothetical protein [Candidatus Daviesbacteria bacterium]
MTTAEIPTGIRIDLKRTFLNSTTVTLLGIAVAAGGFIDLGKATFNSVAQENSLYPYPYSYETYQSAKADKTALDLEVEKIILESTDQAIIPQAYGDRLRADQKIIDGWDRVKATRNDYYQNTFVKPRLVGLPSYPTTDKSIPIMIGSLAFAVLGLFHKTIERPQS